MKRLLFIILICCAVIHAEIETQVSISVSANLATIGDPLQLKIIVKTVPEIDSINLISEQTSFDILEKKTPFRQEKKEYTVIEQDLVVAFFRTGDFEVGPFEIELLEAGKVRDNRKTNSVSVKIQTVLSEEDKDIKPLKDPIRIPGNPLYILKYVFLLLFLAALALYLAWVIKKRRARRDQPPAPVLAPLEELRQRLDTLSALRLFEKGKKIEFFIRLTEIVKDFLRRQYGFNAEDLTTYETMVFFRRAEREMKLIQNMEYVFFTADLVKFAKYDPQTDIFQDVNAKIREIVAVYTSRQLPAEETR